MLVVAVAEVDGELTAAATAAEVGVELAIDDGTGAAPPLLSLFTAVAVTGDDVADGEGVTSGSDEVAGIDEPADSAGWEVRLAPVTEVVEAVPVAAMEEDGERMADSEAIGSPILATTGEFV